MRPLRPLLACALVAALPLAACGDDASTTKTTATARAAACTKASLPTTRPGTLTVATDSPAYPPYFVDDEPANGHGFESAVAYAIARTLGYAPADVRRVVEPFNSSYAPGPKDFDFDVNEISITPQRAQGVDFSGPYFDAPQALVALEGSAAAQATALAGVRGARLGAQAGTTSLEAVRDVIRPVRSPTVLDDSDEVVAALQRRRVDAVVVDLPTAFQLVSAQVRDAKIVGQFPVPGGDRWGALLAKGSPLTRCVTQAVGRLRESGELARITRRWLGAGAGVPPLS